MANEITTRDLARLMRMPGGVDIRDRSMGGLFNTQYFPQCFVGSEAVEWLLMRNICRTRKEALKRGRKLMAEGYLYHVLHDRDFEDSKQLYAFRDIESDTPVQSPIKEGSAIKQRLEAERRGTTATGGGSGGTPSSPGKSSVTSAAKGIEEASPSGTPTNSTSTTPTKKQKPTLKQLPRLKGFLELHEDQGGLFGSAGFKRRFFVLERSKKAPAILVYPESMEQCLKRIDLDKIANVGPTGAPWEFDVFVSANAEEAQERSYLADPTAPLKPKGRGRSGTFSERYHIRASTKEQMQFWVDGIIRWVDYVRSEKTRKQKQRLAKEPANGGKGTLLDELNTRLNHRIDSTHERRVQQLESEQHQTERELARHKRRADELQRECDLLRQQVDKLRQLEDPALAELARRQIEALEREAAEENARLAVDDEDIEENGDGSGDATMSHPLADSKGSPNAKSSSPVAIKGRRVRRSGSTLATTPCNHHAELEEKNKELAKLRTQVANLTERLSAVEKGDAAETIARLQAQVESLSVQLSQSTDMAADVTHDKSDLVQRMERRERDLLEQIKVTEQQLEQQFSVMEMMKKQLLAAAERQDELATENELLLDKLAELTLEIGGEGDEESGEEEEEKGDE